MPSEYFVSMFNNYFVTLISMTIFCKTQSDIIKPLMKIEVRIYNNLFISKAPNHDTNYDSGYNEEFFTLKF